MEVWLKLFYQTYYVCYVIKHIVTASGRDSVWNAIQAPLGFSVSFRAPAMRNNSSSDLWTLGSLLEIVSMGLHSKYLPRRDGEKQCFWFYMYFGAIPWRYSTGKKGFSAFPLIQGRLHHHSAAQWNGAAVVDVQVRSHAWSADVGGVCPGNCVNHGCCRPPVDFPWWAF